MFDRVYSLVKEFSCLTPGCKLNLVESLRSNLSVLLPTVDSLLRVSQQKDGNADEEKNDSEEDECSLADRVASYRNAFKIYTFFLIHIVLIEESTSSSNNSTKVNFFLYLIVCVCDACSILTRSAILWNAYNEFTVFSQFQLHV